MDAGQPPYFNFKKVNQQNDRGSKISFIADFNSRLTPGFIFDKRNDDIFFCIFITFIFGDKNNIYFLIKCSQILIMTYPEYQVGLLRNGHNPIDMSTYQAPITVE